MTYKITDVQFSIKDESVTNPGNSEPTLPYPATRKLTLVALVSFEYVGISPDKQYGTATYEFGEVGSAEIDKDGFYTSFSPEDLSSLTVASMMSQIETLVESTINSIIVKTTVDAYSKSTLNHFRTLKDENTGEGFPSMYNEGQPRYKELEDWNTGIGAVKTNMLTL